MTNFENKGNHGEESEKVDDIEAQTVCQSQVLKCLFAQGDDEWLVSIMLHLKEATNTDFRLLYWKNGINHREKHCQNAKETNWNENVNDAFEQNFLFLEVIHFLKLVISKV